jgi:hypothetical protein
MAVGSKPAWVKKGLFGESLAMLLYNIDSVCILGIVYEKKKIRPKTNYWPLMLSRRITRTLSKNQKGPQQKSVLELSKPDLSSLVCVRCKKNVSITQSPSLGMAALELIATPQLSF